MDTKWNDMSPDRDKPQVGGLEPPEPSEIPVEMEKLPKNLRKFQKQAQKQARRKSRERSQQGTENAQERLNARSVIAFLAFVLGISLIIGNLGIVAGRLAWERDSTHWWETDWQDTDAFRWKVSQYLENFLTIGAGGKTLRWYDSDGIWEYGLDGDLYSYYRTDNSAEATIDGGWYDPYIYDGDASIGLEEQATVIESKDINIGGLEFDFGLTKPQLVQMTANSSSPTPQDPQQPESKKTERPLDIAFRQNRNVLYKITQADGTVYSNLDSGQNLDDRKYLPEGYNFYLAYQDGKVSIVKDGKTLDVYGDGVFTGDSLWYVPGYQNFKAGSEVDGVRVQMAVAKIPARYITTDYNGYGTQEGDRMYYLYQDIQGSRNFYRNAAIYLAAGLLLIGIAFALRKYREPVNRKIASWTTYIWTEGRFLLVSFFILALILPPLGDNHDIVGNIYYSFAELYRSDSDLLQSLSTLGRSLFLIVENIVPLLGLIWSIWLIHNDHKYNPKESRRSLYRTFQAYELKRPIQKRLIRVAVLQILCGCILMLFSLILIILCWNVFYGGRILFTLIILLFCVLPAGWSILAGRTEFHLAKDIGLLSDQIESVRTGDLTMPLDLPKDADLYQTAEALNDIQSGMKAALEEQTRSERMKVELVSNVSHDLKTPLTSVLSYAELLRQEELPPVAADYARIIDEKAQRLKSMVQDVFEVSKAAADQLPVHIERLDLAKLLRQTLADMDASIQNSALLFKIDLPEGPVMIEADGKRLYRVFQNLIQNALQYALEGSRVYLTLKTYSGQAEAVLRNTSKVELPEGVDFTARFVRGDASRTDGGSGLGLSIVKSFTEACGGNFQIQTLADLFTAIVTFPLA